MTTIPTYNSPPVWGADQTFESWKSEIEVWKLVTSLEAKKRGAAVALSLSGSRREVARSVPNTEFGNDDGLDKVLNKLETALRTEGTDRAFDAYIKFDNVRRTESETVSQHIQNFDELYTKIQQAENGQSRRHI